MTDMIPISRRAILPEGCHVHVMPSGGVLDVEHRLSAPVGSCPVSGNPISGTVIVQYEPAAYVAEAVSLHQLVTAAPARTRSVEGLCVHLATELARALSCVVTVELDLLIQPGPQVYRVRARR